MFLILNICLFLFFYEGIFELIKNTLFYLTMIVFLVNIFFIIKKKKLLKLKKTDIFFYFLVTLTTTVILFILSVLLFLLIDVIKIIFTNKNIIYATEIHKVFRFGILRYLVAHPHEYGAVVHGIINPMKNCIFIPSGMDASLKGHDGLMYNLHTSIIDFTVQMKKYSGTSIINNKSLQNLIQIWIKASKFSDQFWVDTIYKDYLIEYLKNDNIFLNSKYFGKKLLLINSQDFLLNEQLIIDIQEKIDKNNSILKELLVQAEPAVAGHLKINAEVGLDPLYDDVFHRDGLQESITYSTGKEKEYAILHLKTKNAVRDAFFKTGIMKK